MRYRSEVLIADADPRLRISHGPRAVSLAFSLQPLALSLHTASGAAGPGGPLSFAAGQYTAPPLHKVTSERGEVVEGQILDYESNVA